MQIKSEEEACEFLKVLSKDFLVKYHDFNDFLTGYYLKSEDIEQRIAASISIYGGRSKHIKNFHRGIDKLLGGIGGTNYITDKTLEYTFNNKMCILNEDLTLYRVVLMNELVKMISNNKKRKLIKGNCIIEKGYLGTSLMDLIPAKNSQCSVEREFNTLMIINVKKGREIIPIHQISPRFREFEILFNKNTKMQVMKIQKKCILNLQKFIKYEGIKYIVECEMI